MYARIMTAIPG